MKFINVHPQLEKNVREKIEATLNVCRTKYNRDFPTPPLKFSQSGRTAGYCSFTFIPFDNTVKNVEIIINPDYFKNNYDEMLNITVPHEVAHYVSVALHGRRGNGHGWAWQRVMIDLGLSPERCHNYDTSEVKTREVARPYLYTCGCKDMTHKLTRNIHTKHQSGRYRKCKRCHTRLVYIGFNKDDDTFVPRVPNPNRVVLSPNVVIPLPKQITIVPIPVEPPKPMFRSVTRFINGTLTNIRVPITE